MAAKYDRKGRQSYRSGHVIALNLQMYISFEIQHLQFIDWYQFLNSSLEKLVKYLSTALLRHARKYLGSNELLFAKGIFSYEWFDLFEKLDRTDLPPKDAVYSLMNKESITDDEYSRPQNIWTTFDWQTCKDYRDLYLKTDAFLLSDVFENFRDVSMVNFCLDPAHYLTTPSLTWDTCLKLPKVQLELITDPEIFFFFEGGIRGSISTISNRYARVINPSEKSEVYDSTRSHSLSFIWTLILFL
jgi:hypothetical protein